MSSFKTNGIVHKIIADDNGNLFVGGEFTQVGLASGSGGTGIVSATGIAKYVPLEDKWYSIGSVSTSGKVYALDFDSTYANLYIGGSFTSVIIGTTTVTTTNIAKYNISGNTWDGIRNSSNTIVNAPGIIYDLGLGGNNTIYISGDFQSPCAIARFVNGWVDLGVGVSAGGCKAYALKFNSDKSILYLGGNFNKLGQSGNTASNSIVKYTVSTNILEALGNGVTNSSDVLSITLDSNGNLFAGGNFSSAGSGTTVNNIAKWSSSTWSALGSGTVGISGTKVNSLAVDSSNNIYAGGVFTSAGGTTMANFARYNQSANTWSKIGDITLSSNSDGSINTMLVVGNNLYIGGNFKRAYSSYTATDNCSYLNIYNIDDGTLTDTPDFTSINSAGNGKLNLQNYLEKYLNPINFSKAEKFKTNLQNNKSKFTNKKATINITKFNGSYFIKKSANFSNLTKLNGQDMNLDYHIPEDNQQNGKNVYDLGEITQTSGKILKYIPVKNQEEFFVKINGIIYGINNNNNDSEINSNNGFKFNRISDTNALINNINVDNQILYNNTSDNTKSIISRIIGLGGELQIFNEVIPCLFEDTIVLTPNGYVNIKELKIGDLVITEDNRNVEIVNIFSSKIIGNYNNYPYIVEKNTLGENYPAENITLSRGHLIKYQNKWYLPCKLTDKRKIIDNFNYYHIELKNYLTDNLVINNGTVVESFGGLKKENADIYRNRELNKII